MQDLILSVVKNRRWEDLDCYAISLKRSGYEGRAVMLVEDVNPDVTIQLNEYGIETIPTKTCTNAHFQTTRFIPALEYLHLHHGEFRNVLWADACDLVFQTNPFEILEKEITGFNYLIAAKEGWLIKNQGINDIWVRKLVAEQTYRKLREEEILCSGTIAGTSEAMEFLFQEMVDRMVGIDSMQGIDQGLFNVIARMEPFKSLIRIPEPDEAWVSTVGIFASPSDPAVWTIPMPYFDDSGRVWTKPPVIGGRLFAIQHQYNRHHGIADPDGTWRYKVEANYRNHGV